MAYRTESEHSSVAVVLDAYFGVFPGVFDLVSLERLCSRGFGNGAEVKVQHRRVWSASKGEPMLQLTRMEDAASEFAGTVSLSLGPLSTGD